MTLRRHNMEFLNGNWRVTAIDGQPIDDEEANVFIDIAELKIHGNTGCNYFNGAIYIDPARTNAIDFSDMGVTRMACHKAEQEHRKCSWLSKRPARLSQATTTPCCS